MRDYRKLCSCEPSCIVYRFGENAACMKQACSKIHSSEKLKLQEMFSIRRASPVFYIHHFRFPTLLDFVDSLHQGFYIKMRVDFLCQRHGTGVTDNLLDHCRVHMGVSQHADASVASIVVIHPLGDLARAVMIAM